MGATDPKIHAHCTDTPIGHLEVPHVEQIIANPPYMCGNSRTGRLLGISCCELVRSDRPKTHALNWELGILICSPELGAPSGALTPTI